MEYLRRLGRRKSRYLCQCDCGVVREVIPRSLREGRSLSCGCLAKDINTRHGGHGCPEYESWKGMWNRCTKKDDRAYPYYGGRGVRVHFSWRDLDVFRLDVGPRPGPEYSIDRIDNDGHYEPGNCRWATMKEQSRNRRSNRLLELGGVVLPVTVWSERVGICAGTLFKRLRLGWSVEKVLMSPVR